MTHYAKKSRVLRGKRTYAKRHNSALKAKVELREWLVEQLGGKPRVLDCFCAGGMLWERAYRRTKRYLGLDVRSFEDARLTIVCDSRRFLRHQDAPILEFDLFDLDAYASPLEHLVLLCLRLKELRPGRRVGIVLTDGMGVAVRQNNIPRGMLAFLGISLHRGTRVHFDNREEIFRMGVDRALALGGLRIVEGKHVQAKGGAEMHYVALLCERARA